MRDLLFDWLDYFYHKIQIFSSSIFDFFKLRKYFYFRLWLYISLISLILYLNIYNIKISFELAFSFFFGGYILFAIAWSLADYPHQNNNTIDLLCENYTRNDIFKFLKTSYENKNRNKYNDCEQISEEQFRLIKAILVEYPIYKTISKESLSLYVNKEFWFNEIVQENKAAKETFLNELDQVIKELKHIN